MRKLVAAILATFSTAALADGAATFSAKCKACHGPDGSGTKIAAKHIAGLPAEDVKKVLLERKDKHKAVVVDNADEVAAYVAGMKK